jgi:hypothetical protein
MRILGRDSCDMELIECSRSQAGVRIDGMEMHRAAARLRIP